VGRFNLISKVINMHLKELKKYKGRAWRKSIGWQKTALERTQGRRVPCHMEATGRVLASVAMK
jgi:hypothetical protein